MVSPAPLCSSCTEAPVPASACSWLGCLSCHPATAQTPPCRLHSKPHHKADVHRGSISKMKKLRVGATLDLAQVAGVSLCALPLWPGIQLSPLSPYSGSRDIPLGTRHCWCLFSPVVFPVWAGWLAGDKLSGGPPVPVPFRCPRAAVVKCLAFQGIVLCVRLGCQRQLWPDAPAAPSLRNLEPRQPGAFLSPLIYIKAVLSSSVMRPGVMG